MTLHQAEAFGLIAVAVGMFAWGRFRYDLVSLGVLLAGVLIGVVPAKRAFDGFSNEIVIIIGAALVVSAGIARSGVVEAAMRPLLPRLKTEQAQVPALVIITMLISMVTKNVGALAMMMPVALQIARNTGVSPGRLLMPMSFASLLGGLVTLIGTSPNIIVSEVRQQVSGHPFQLFDFAPVGLGLAGLGALFLAFGYRLLPKKGLEAQWNRKGAQGSRHKSSGPEPLGSRSGFSYPRSTMWQREGITGLRGISFSRVRWASQRRIAKSGG